MVLPWTPHLQLHGRDSCPVAFKIIARVYLTWHSGMVHQDKFVMWAFPEVRPDGPRERRPCTESTGTGNSHHQKRKGSASATVTTAPASCTARISRAPPQFTTHLFHSPSTLLNFSESSLSFSLPPLHPSKSIRVWNSPVH